MNIPDTVHQSRNGYSTTADSEKPDMTRDLGDLGTDLLTLGELQLELLSTNARDVVQQSFVPTIWAFLGLGFVVGCCPIALLGLTWWLADQTALSLSQSALTVSGAGLVIAGLFLFLAWRGYRASFKLLGRSRLEFRSNLQWIKSLISKGSRRRYR